jgi:hypothetical protein
MTDASPKRFYQPSPRHCEPITAENPGVKCPSWSVACAQDLLDSAETVSDKELQNTRNGLGFVARLTRRTATEEIWHGYPEAWDKMDAGLKRKWLAAGLISRKDLRGYASRYQVRNAFGGKLIAG